MSYEDTVQMRVEEMMEVMNNHVDLPVDLKSVCRLFALDGLLSSSATSISIHRD